MGDEVVNSVVVSFLGKEVVSSVVLLVIVSFVFSNVLPETVLVLSKFVVLKLTVVLTFSVVNVLVFEIRVVIAVDKLEIAEVGVVLGVIFVVPCVIVV